jgi:hypothetical protein
MLKEWQGKYNIIWISKLGTDLEVILFSNANECKKVTKKDTIIIWGGTREVSKNEYQKGQKVSGNSYK